MSVSLMKKFRDRLLIVKSYNIMVSQIDEFDLDQDCAHSLIELIFFVVVANLVLT